MLILLILTLPNLCAVLMAGSQRALAVMLLIQGAALLLLPAILGGRLQTWLKLCLPVGVLVPAAAAFVLTTGYQPSEWALLLLIEANDAEFREFAAGIALALIMAPLLILGLRWMVRNWVPANFQFQGLEKAGIGTLALLLPITETSMIGLPHGLEPSFKRLEKTFPFSIGIGAWKCREARQKLVRRNSLQHSFTVQRAPNLENHRQIHLLMLGETCRYANFSRHGYARITSPKLDARGSSLLDFKDVVSPASYTSLSVPMLLTGRDATCHPAAPHSPSLLNVFREAGYKVYWLSTQKKAGVFETSSSLYAQDADEARFLSGLLDASSSGGYTSALDTEFIPAVRDLLARQEPRVLIICHSMGSHARYVDRYPPEFGRFPADPSLCVNAKYEPRLTEEQKTHLQNSYDNSILFTDHVIDQLIQVLESQAGAAATFTFLPDHGENDGSALMMPFAHGINSVDVLHVPMFIWLSPEIRRLREPQTRLLAGRQHAPFSGAHLFDTLIDLAGIECSLVRPQRSLSHPGYDPGPRWVSDENGSGHRDFDLTIAPLGKRKGWQPLFPQNPASSPAAAGNQ